MCLGGESGYIGWGWKSCECMLYVCVWARVITCDGAGDGVLARAPSCSSRKWCACAHMTICAQGWRWCVCAHVRPRWRSGGGLGDICI